MLETRLQLYLSSPATHSHKGHTDMQHQPRDPMLTPCSNSLHLGVGEMYLNHSPHTDTAQDFAHTPNHVSGQELCLHP